MADNPAADRGRDANLAATRKRVDHDFAARLGRDANGNDFGIEVAGSVRFGRALMACERETVLLFARQTEFGSDQISLRRHRHGKILIPQSVVDHGVDQLAVSEAVSEPCAAQQIRRVRHRLHTAGGDDRTGSGVDRPHRIHDREKTRRAHFVDRFGGDGFRKAGFKDHLASRVLARAGLQHLPENRVVDVARIDARALDGGG
jgi:hypothetical protein